MLHFSFCMPVRLFIYSDIAFRHGFVMQASPDRRSCIYLFYLLPISIFFVLYLEHLSLSKLRLISIDLFPFHLVHCTHSTFYLTSFYQFPYLPILIRQIAYVSRRFSHIRLLPPSRIWMFTFHACEFDLFEKKYAFTQLVNINLIDFNDFILGCPKSF